MKLGRIVIIVTSCCMTFFCAEKINPIGGVDPASKDSSRFPSIPRSDHQDHHIDHSRG